MCGQRCALQTESRPLMDNILAARTEHRYCPPQPHAAGLAGS